MVREPSTRLADRRGGQELELLVTLGDFLTISKVLGSPREKEQILLRPQLTDLSFIISVVGELRLRGRVVGNKDAVHVVSGLRV